MRNAFLNFGMVYKKPAVIEMHWLSVVDLFNIKTATLFRGGDQCLFGDSITEVK